MRHRSCAALATLLALSTFACGGPVPSTPHRRSKLPFTDLVVYGDSLSDNGSGSWAHGLDPWNVYAYFTWTDGPVAATYLANLLGVPLKDYAFGGIRGGGLPGATLSNDYSPAKDSWQGRPVPSTKEQIANYTSDNRGANIKTSLQLIWAGQNDAKQHTNWYAKDPADITITESKNAGFISSYASILLNQAEHLIEHGAPAVVVMNIYPLNEAPENLYYFCKTPIGSPCSVNWGNVLNAANNHLAETLAKSKYSDKIIYYDVNGFMKSVMARKNDYGFTAPLNEYCDGDHSLAACKWDQCRSVPGHGNWAGARPFFWFDNGQPSTQMHGFIAQNLRDTIEAHVAHRNGGSASGWAKTGSVPQALAVPPVPSAPLG